MPLVSARRAFTLIETLVTLVILGILVAAAAVTWNWVVEKSEHDRAQALLDRVVTIEQTIARDWGSYTAWPADLVDVGSDVRVLNDAPSKGPTQVSAVVGSGGSLALAVQATDDRCVFRVVAPLTDGASASDPGRMTDGVSCTARSALPNAESPLRQTSALKTSAR